MPPLPLLSHVPDRNGRAPVRVLMVCMGNICRSPTAHGVLDQLVRNAGLAGAVQVDSAGTHAEYHGGEPPDARARRHALARGYELGEHRARLLERADFEVFDLVLVMDMLNERSARKLAPAEHVHKLYRLTDFCIRFAGATEVPDPYDGGETGFERVLDLIEDACAGVLLALRPRLTTGSSARAPM